ncbi:MAG TPA: EAL domain-containing protein [Xanthobacteraceae bacterium]|nr:EAL domain-containing protein [Xanthobacteraceae bacterium]
MIAPLRKQKVECPPLLSDKTFIERMWRGSIAPGQKLPRYEDVVLGSLGRLADHLLLFEGGGAPDFKILRAGRKIREWLGVDLRDKGLGDLPRDCAIALSEALAQAVTANTLVPYRMYRVTDGMVENYEMLAFPMACRWGPPLVGVYVAEAASRYNLVDTIFRSTDEGIVALAIVRDGKGLPVNFQIVAFNQGAAKLLGIAEDSMQWSRLSDLPLGATALLLRDRLVQSVALGQRDQFEFSIPAAHRDAYLNGANPGDMHLNVGIASVGDLLSMTLTDIRELKQREASFRLLFDGNPVPMWLYDPNGLKVLGVNDAAIAHYGYSRAQWLNKTLPDLWPEDERDIHREVASSVGDNYQSDRTWRHLKADGSEIEVLVYARRVPYGSKQAVLVAVVDVTERKAAEARIAYMAHHDALTGLPNRILFHERLNELLARVRRTGESLAVHCLDLDHFKGVNDTLGHPIGDELLQTVAKRLGHCLRDTDTVARLGGDEFAVVQFPLRGPHEASALANTLIDVVSKSYEVHGHEFVVGASIGIALAPSDGDSADALLRNVDMALYRAKAEGRGSAHFFEPDMDRRIQARRVLELDLRKAFANGEFELYYQPLVSLDTDAISGFEALLRWRHPERGMIAPAEFIPLAEEIGLIVQLGEWVLRQACTEAMRWPSDLKIAVNLSPAQFRSRGVIKAVLTALAYSRLAADRLELEITESVLLGETEANLATLHQLREIGVRISMDDFGTGYSSLSYLRCFPFDKIKIDRSFVSELSERPDCVAIIRAVAGLGMSLGIATTAEGIETPEQLARVRAEGCTEVQGYFFSPPRPASEINGIIARSGRKCAAVA